MRLAEHTTITAGHPFRSRIKAEAGSDIVAVQMKDTSESSGIRWDQVTRTLPVTADPAWLAAGDVLLAARGNQNYAVLVTTPPEGFQVLAAPHWYVIRPKTNNLLPEFLCWLLNRKPVRDYFRRESAGTTTLNLRREAVDKLKIAIPPLKDQQRIAALDAAARRERALHEQLIANTERFNDGLARRLLNNATSGINT